ncbi:MAG TPA: TonB family protein [Bacteroidales bacterium]|nr:TonB family protein [Bacteroidales bacterium]HOM40791.1 TonB family protein [Bacteroidales bacterium]
MQLHQNSSVRKIPSEKGKGLAGTILFHAGLFILFLVIGFSVRLPDKPESGILVNFGFDDTGSGLIEPSGLPSQPEATPLPVQAQEETTVKDEALLTQDFDKEVPEVKKADPEAEKKKQEQIEAEKKRQADLEAERLKREKEEEERRRLEEEQKRVNEILNKTKNALAGAKNTGTDSRGEGVAGGQGNQGVPEGSPDSKIRGEGSGLGDRGISYSLEGRGFQSLPPPKYDYQGEGRVVVEVSVDRNGKVIQAIPGAKGSTTLDEYLLNAAKEAALKAVFEPKPDAPVIQKGTITYNFVLK